ncbi:MAG: hypothetical protein IPJ81_00025 [Chitinophagaceae bacterium]|nr:hypothetical protein [Chitinophagaceae bacterium]
MEVAIKIRNCKLIERSINNESIATTPAPTAKKKRINPGTTNSSRKSTKPIMNHITAAL